MFYTSLSQVHFSRSCPVSITELTAVVLCCRFLLLDYCYFILTRYTTCVCSYRISGVTVRNDRGLYTKGCDFIFTTFLTLFSEMNVTNSAKGTWGFLILSQARGKVKVTG